jgi:hypothetical protein
VLENARTGMNPRSGDAKFHELLTLLREDQLRGGIAFQSRPDAGKKAMAMILRAPADEAMAARNRRIAELLGVKADLRELDVGYGSIPAGNTEIMLLTRSMLQIMIDVASYFDVPERDVADGRTVRIRRTAEDEKLFPAVMRVRESADQPADAFVSIRYRGHWFWIDDRDMESKRIFAFLMLMFSLTETGGSQAAPVLTIPAR